MKPKRFQRLSELRLDNFPELKQLASKTVALWPEHEPTVATSLGNRSLDVLEDSNQIASIVNKIAISHFGNVEKVCLGYKYFCQEMILESELFFRRHGKYERTTFEQAYNDVYSNKVIMEKYMDGLLVSGVLWNNHANALTYYKRNFLELLPKGFSHLEVGPGHGTLLYLAASHVNSGVLTGWDVSPSSIQATSRTLLTLDETKVYNLECQDMFDAQCDAEKFDSIVISEVLEHLENPMKALSELYKYLKPGGFIWVNMPANSPSPDHLYLVKNSDEVSKLVTDAGFNILKREEFPMTGYSLEDCKKNELTITCVVVATKS